MDIRKYIFHSFLGLALVTTNSARADYIGLPKPGTLSRNEFQAVFSVTEIKTLKKMGLDQIAGAVLIPNNIALKNPELSKRYDFDDDGSGKLQEVDDYVKQQWSIHNNGEDQRIILDKYNTGWIKGIENTDTGLKRLPTVLNEKREVKVAVIDTGAEWEHPDLQGALLKNSADCGSATDDLDNNGYANDCLGWNVVTNNGNTQDTAGHGTHVSGLIAARAYNKIGVQGISQMARIIPIKAIDKAPNAPVRPQSLPVGEDDLPSQEIPLTQNIMKALLYAKVRGAEVINMSLAWPASFRSKAVETITKKLISDGVLIVAAAGNDSTFAHVYPCRIDGVICVGAHGPSGGRAHFSNYGPMVDVFAPGQWMLSTWVLSKYPTYFRNEIGYDFRDGTSMAAPIVAGALARLISTGFSAEESRIRLTTFTRNLNSDSSVISRIKDAFHTVLSGLNSFNATTENGQIDLELATKSAAIPHFIPKNKGFVPVFWDGTSNNIRLNLEIKNEWIDARNVTIQIGKTAVHDVRMSFTPFVRSVVTQAETIILPITLNFDSDTLPWQVPVHVIVQDQQSGSHTLTFLVQFLRKLSDPAATDIQKQNIDSLQLTPNSEIFPLRDEKQKELNKWVSVNTNRDNKTTYQIFDRDYASPHFNIALPAKADIKKVYLLSSNEIVFWLRFTPEGEKKDAYRFQYVGSDFIPGRSLDASVALAPMSEDFIWINDTGPKGTKTFTPAWVSRGLTPELDKPKYSPWKKAFQDVITQRVYTFTDAKVRLIPFPEIETPFSTIPEFGQVVLGTGTGYDLDFSLVTIKDRNTLVRNPVKGGDFRNYGAASQSGSVLNDDAIFFTSTTSFGGQHITIVDSKNYTVLKDVTLNPKSYTDNLLRIVAVYNVRDEQGEHYVASVQSHFGLRFYNLDQENALESTISRFSYLPSLAFLKSFFPILTKNKNGQDVPLVYSTGGPFPGDVQEFFTPGRRLAKTRFIIPANCQSLGVTADGTSQWVCPDSVNGDLLYSVAIF